MPNGERLYEKVMVLTCDIRGFLSGIVDLNLLQVMELLQQAVHNIFCSCTQTFFLIFSMAQCTNISCYSRNKHVWRGQQLITLNISAVIIFQRHLLNNHRHTSTASIWIEIVIYGKNNWCRMQNNNKDISYRHDTGGTPLCAKPLSQNH